MFRNCLLAILLVVNGCAFLRGSGEEPSRVKQPSREALIVSKEIAKKDLQVALGNELKTAQVRAVEVFQNATGAPQTFPNFRLFDIEAGSVYELLDLRNADILVAINKRAVVAPHVLTQVVRLLPNEKGVEFEIIRAGKSMLVKITFV